MKVVYRGNFLPDHGTPGETGDDNIRWSTECQIAWTLEAMGHEVVRAQEFRSDHTGVHEDVTWESVLGAADGADLFLWTQTHNVDPEGGYRALDALRAMRVPSVSFHLDLYWGLERQAQIMEQPFWRTDLVITADGGHDEGFARNGIRHHWMPPAIYRPDAVQGAPSENYRQWPIIFVGSYPYPHPTHTEARRQIVTNLQSHFAPQFRHYRTGVRRKELCDLYASVRVVVGDSCHAGQVPLYWSERLPEALGRQAFLVHPYVPGIEEWYKDGEHLRVFEAGDMGQMLDLVKWGMAHPEDADRIAAAGRELVLSRDCYEHRLTEMFDLVEELR